jgi:hypothetical protein
MTNHVTAPAEPIHEPPPEVTEKVFPSEHPTITPPSRLVPLTKEEGLTFDNLQLKFDNIQLRKRELARVAQDLGAEEKALMAEAEAARVALGDRLVADPKKLQIDSKTKMVKVP